MSLIDRAVLEYLDREEIFFGERDAGSPEVDEGVLAVAAASAGELLATVTDKEADEVRAVARVLMLASRVPQDVVAREGRVFVLGEPTNIAENAEGTAYAIRLAMVDLRDRIDTASACLGLSE